jgi:nucleoside 2-deoxyribosyltransferase
LEEQIRPEGMSDEQFGRKMANKDLQEIAAADCFIIDLMAPSQTMGKMVEAGFAMAKHKLFYVVAPEGTFTKGHIFMMLADKRFSSWDELFEWFKITHSNGPKQTAVEYVKSMTAQTVGTT